ncbi:MAG: NAD(P)/FAD-dependent oxidoreductase [Bdellovibrionales bacterium]
MRIRIIGAGFTGLTTAYFANQMGFDVEVLEAKPRVGGLISTKETPYGLVETAANGLLNSELVEQLFKDLELQLLPMSKSSRARYIFTKGKTSRWPLSPFESMGFFARLAKVSATFKKSWKPRRTETIHHWGLRTIGLAATEKLLIPALQGIYAGQPQELSATLILGRFFNPQIKSYRGKNRGTVSAAAGMGQLVESLEHYLIQRGVRIRKNQTIDSETLTLRNSGVTTVIATSVDAAADLLSHTSVGPLLKQVDLLPIVTVTTWFDLRAKYKKGFGCLFPRQQNVRALGVLFNDQIFDGRSQYYSETWIYGGATDRSFIEFSEAEILRQVKQDHGLLHGEQVEPLDSVITRWPKAIPHYSVQLENLLRNSFNYGFGIQPVVGNIYLNGNYLGSLGLSKILERSKELVAHIANDRVRKQPLFPDQMHSPTPAAFVDLM